MVERILKKVFLVLIIYFSIIAGMFLILVLTMLISLTQIVDVMPEDLFQQNFKLKSGKKELFLEKCDSLLRSDYWFTHKINQVGDTIENESFTDLRRFYVPTVKCYYGSNYWDKQYGFYIKRNNLNFEIDYDEPFFEPLIIDHTFLHLIPKNNQLYTCNTIWNPACRVIYLFTFGLPQSFKITVGLCIYMIIFTLAEEGINRYIRRRREKAHSPEQEEELI